METDKTNILLSLKREHPALYRALKEEVFISTDLYQKKV